MDETEKDILIQSLHEAGSLNETFLTNYSSRNIHRLASERAAYLNQLETLETDYRRDGRWMHPIHYNNQRAYLTKKLNKNMKEIHKFQGAHMTPSDVIGPFNPKHNIRDQTSFVMTIRNYGGRWGRVHGKQTWDHERDSGHGTRPWLGTITND